MRDTILNAAEAVVRCNGLEALTVRAVADRAHYGKSTIHTLIGTKAELVEALADRISERHIATLKELRGGPDDTRDGRFLCTADLILDSGDLAKLMFGRSRPPDLVAWSHRWIATFSDEILDALGESDEVALAEALFLAHQQLVPVIDLVANSGDRAFGARVLREVFGPFSALVRELEAQWGVTPRPASPTD